MNRLRLLRGVLLLTPMAIAALLVWPDIVASLVAGQYNGGADFDVFYSGAALFEQARFAELWDPDGFAASIGRDEPYLWYAYPPVYASAWRALTGLSIDAAWVTWTVAGMAAIPVAVRVVSGRWDLPVTLLVLTVYPAALNFQLGQNAALSALIIAVAAGLLRRGRPLWAGVVLGLLVYKPQLAIGIGLWWLLDERYRPAGLAALGTAGSIAGISWLIHPDAWTAYGTTAFEVAAVPTQILQVSLPGFFELALPGWDAARIAGLVVAVVVVAAFVWWIRRAPRSFETALAVAVMVTLLCAPYLIVYDYLIGLAPLALLLRERDLTPLWLAGAALSWAVLYTYVVRGVATDLIGVPIQILPLVLAGVLVHFVRQESSLPSRA